MSDNLVSTITREKLLSSKILVVDDTSFNRVLIKEMLASEGYSNVTLAENGQQAYDMLPELQPDILILDLLMPVMDGYAFCKAVRKKKDYSMLPILVQTALDKVKQKSLAFKSGATDFISKPIEKSELLARVKVHLERYHWYMKVCESEKRMSEELSHAKQMQAMIIPSDAMISDAETTCHLLIASHFQTSSELGGDVWGLQKLSDHECAFYMVDFSGHGVTAALNTFRLHTIIQSNDNEEYMGCRSTARINAKLTGLLPIGQFATMAYAVIDTKNHEMRMTTAAAPKPIILRKSGAIETLSGEGFPLGIKKDAEYEVRRFPFAPGDALFLYSDALIETPDSFGVHMNEEALLHWFDRTIKEQGGLDCKELQKALSEHFQLHYGERVDDDLTMLFVQAL